MTEATGNIWTWINKGAKVVIPVNIGWTKDGTNVMGAGLAKQAARNYPDLPKWFGAICRERKKLTPVVAHPKHPIICFPTKELNEEHPELSWKNPSDLWLIEGSLMDLNELPGTYPIAVPLVGTGNGGLDPRQVLRVLRLYLKSDRFTVVHPPGTVRVAVPDKKEP